jgi:3-phosphoshikimate 1-carboxyvinyltransferase
MIQKKFNLFLNSQISNYKKKIYVDSDKSISIRSFLIGSISNNISKTNNVLESEDVFSTISCLKKLGVKIKKNYSKNYSIYGKSLGSLYIKKGKELNFGNSGTLERLLIGILSTTPDIDVKLRGDHSLNKRSMEKLINLMSKFGATFYPRGKYKFPLRLISSKMPLPINYPSGSSAQLKSAVILAALNSYGDTIIIEKQKSRNHTENMIARNKQSINIKKNTIRVKGKKFLEKIDINVPGDPSSASFFTALTLLSQKSSLIIKNVGLNSSRIGFYKLLKKHGANIKFKNLKKDNFEIVGDIFVKSCKLKPIKASKKYYVNTTDEYPILFVIAALIKGVSVFEGIKDLANKESNRITEMQKVLDQLGIKSIYAKNKLKIFGSGIFNGRNKTINIPNLGDHRICMSSFILALLTGTKAKIKNFETVYTSSPSFLNIMKKLGARFEIKKIS